MTEAKHPFGSSAWVEAEVARQRRDADRLRTLLLCLRVGLSALGLTLTGVEVASDRGRARRCILSMLDARDAVSFNLVQRPGALDENTIVEVDGLAVRERPDRR